MNRRRDVIRETLRSFPWEVYVDAEHEDLIENLVDAVYLDLVSSEPVMTESLAAELHAASQEAMKAAPRGERYSAVKGVYRYVTAKLLDAEDPV